MAWLGCVGDIDVRRTPFPVGEQGRAIALVSFHAGFNGPMSVSRCDGRPGWLADALGNFMSQVELAQGPIAAPGGEILARARDALAHERAGRFREAWAQWEALRRADPGRSDWNAPLAASYLRYAFDWTADAGEGSLAEAEAALLRGVSILTIDLAEHSDDVARLMLIARACEQRCLLRAYGEGWTRAVREALDEGVAGPVIGEPRQVHAAGVAAATALDLVAISAPSIATIAAELAQSCMRLSTTLEAAGATDEARALELRAELALSGPAPTPEERRSLLVAIEGGAGEATTPPRRPELRIVTNPTA